MVVGIVFLGAIDINGVSFPCESQGNIMPCPVRYCVRYTDFRIIYVQIASCAGIAQKSICSEIQFVRSVTEWDQCACMVCFSRFYEETKWDSCLDICTDKRVGNAEISAVGVHNSTFSCIILYDFRNLLICTVCKTFSRYRCFAFGGSRVEIFVKCKFSY